MAGRAGIDKSNRSTKLQTVNIDFEGVIPTSIRSEIIKELVKYILYERGQIPMCYDQMREFIMSEKTAGVADKCRGTKTSSKEQLVFIQGVDSLFDTIADVFANVAPIKEILIILGSSIFSPRDLYLISFPVEFYEGTVLTRQVCVQQIFQQLITTDFMDNVKALTSCTSLFLLFLAPRNCNHQVVKLVPKLSFNIPNRGTRFFINFSFSTVLMASSDLDISNNEGINLSGIEALNNSMDDKTVLGEDGTISNSASEANSFKTDAGLPADTASCDDYIWYQAPVVIKGFKDKHLGSNNVW